MACDGPAYALVMESRIGAHLSACLISAAFSALSTVSLQRAFTVAHCAMYKQTLAGGSHCSGPEACLEEFNLLVWALSEPAYPRSL